MGVRYVKIGERIKGRDTTYLVVDFIGEGGMAQVFKAVEVDSGMNVAVKVMKRENYESADTYRREFVVLRGLMHPYIVKLYDFIDTPGYVYIVMEYLPGGSLKERIGFPDKLKLIEDIIKISLAIDFAHANGVIHRDIKPANVLYDRSEEPRITDFGIAINMFSHTVTPAYMAPEQIKGEPLDPRTDIYQLGLMLYEIMTGHLPFEPDNSQEFMQWIDKGLTKEPSLYEKSVPSAFDEIFIKTLSASREHRFKRALDLAVEIVNACKRSGFNISLEVENLFNEVMSRVVVNVDPERTPIYIEDTYLGLTPLVVEKIFPGSKKISIKRLLFHKLDLSVWIEPGETSYFDFELEPHKDRVGPFKAVKPVVDATATMFGLYVLGKDKLLQLTVDDGFHVVNHTSLPLSTDRRIYPLGDALALVSTDEILFLDMHNFSLYHTGFYTKDLTRVYNVEMDSLGVVTATKVYWIRSDGSIKGYKGHYETVAPGKNVIALYDGNDIYIKTPFDERVRFKGKSWIRGMYILDKLGVLMIDYVNHLSFVDFDGNLIDEIVSPFKYPILDIKETKGESYLVASKSKVGILRFDGGHFVFAGSPAPLPPGTYKVVLSKFVPIGPIIVTRNRRISVMDILDPDYYVYDIGRMPGGFTTFTKIVNAYGPYLTVTLTSDNIFVYNVLSWADIQR